MQVLRNEKLAKKLRKVRIGNAKQEKMTHEEKETDEVMNTEDGVVFKGRRM